MQARYYDPVIGRFYSNDPVGSLEAIKRGSPVHGFNRYSYANNNPYKYTDPDGEWAWAWAIAGALINIGVETYKQQQAGNGFDVGKIMIEGGKGLVLGGTVGAGTKLFTSAAALAGAGKVVQTGSGVLGAGTGAVYGTQAIQATDGVVNAIQGDGLVSSNSPTENFNEMKANVAGAMTGQITGKVTQAIGGGSTATNMVREATSATVTDTIKSKLESL